MKDAIQTDREPADDIAVRFIQGFTKLPLDENAHRELVRIVEAERVEQSQITIARVRAAIFDVIDKGRQCEVSECVLRHPWRFDFGWPETDEENQRRTEFADAVVTRLTELREQEKSNGS